MGGKIIHYGVDEFYRLRILRKAGYTVESCISLSEFKWVLYSTGRIDAVAFTEAEGSTPLTAMSLAHGKRSPLILFQGWTPHYQQSDFNLVIPMLTSVDQWLGDIASLIERTRHLVQESSKLRTKSRILREETAALIEGTTLEFRRSAKEMERNRGFKLDFLAQQDDSVRSGIVPGSSGLPASLGIDAIHELRSLMSRCSCAAGTVLFNEGQRGDEIFILLSGKVKLSLNSSDGKRFIVHIANPGETLGLASAFTSCPHGLTAETCHPCELGSVRSSDFLDFLAGNPQAYLVAACEMGRAYYQACARLRTLGANFTVMAKLSGLLLEWSGHGYQTAQGIQFHIALTHEEMGQCIGTTRESVSLVLSDFQLRRIIDQRGTTLTILDRAALETYAGER